MIKKAHEITIDDFDLMEETGSISQFKKWYNVFPSVLFARRIMRTLEPILMQMNDERLDELDLERMRYKGESLVNLNILRAYEKIIANHLINRALLKSIKDRIRSRKLRKITDKSDILRHAIQKVNELTGIKIETIADFERFQNYIVYKTDKLEILFDSDKKQETDKKVRLIRVVFSILIYLGADTVDAGKLTLKRFVELKSLAVEKMDAEKRMLNKYEND